MVWTLLKYGYAFFVPIYSSTAFEYTSNGDPILPIEVPVIGDRWHDLYKATDAAIRASGDYHHIFIEEYWLDPYGYIDVRLGS